MNNYIWTGKLCQLGRCILSELVVRCKSRRARVNFEKLRGVFFPSLPHGWILDPAPAGLLGGPDGKCGEGRVQGQQFFWRTDREESLFFSKQFFSRPQISQISPWLFYGAFSFPPTPHPFFCRYILVRQFCRMLWRKGRENPKIQKNLPRETHRRTKGESIFCAQALGTIWKAFQNLIL